jgi:hypothetical protein
VPRLMPRDIVDDVRTILAGTAIGKGQKPQYVTAYQIFRRLPFAIRHRLVAERGKPGEGSGNEFAASGVVAKACQLINAHVRYLDTEGITFETGTNRTAKAGYQVCAIYRLS